MRIEEGKLYFLKDDYLRSHKDKLLIKNKKGGNYRPFLCVNDPEHPAIKWMVPVSSNLKKYEDVINKNEKAKDLIKFYNTSAFGKRTFLIQNACPCLYRDILKEYQTPNNESIILGKREKTELLKYTKLAVHKLNNNVNVGFISKNTYKEILTTYINQRLISSKNYAILGNEAVKMGNTLSLNGYIIDVNGKRYEVKKAFLNKSKDNINLLTKRGKEKQFSKDCIQNDDIRIQDAADKKTETSTTCEVQELEME